MRCFCLLWLLLCGLSMPVCADTLWLANGDQLQGTLLFLDAGKLVFRAKTIGRVQVPVKKIRTLETGVALHVQVRDQSPPAPHRLHAADPGQVRLDDGRTLALADLHSLMRMRPRSRDWRWEGSLDVSLELENDDDEHTDSLETELKMRLLNHRWRHALEVESEREVEEEATSENNFSLDYTLDRFFDAHWFWRVHARLDRDYEENDMLTREYGSGPGYQFWDDERGRFNLNTEWLRIQFRGREIDGIDAPLTFGFNLVGLGWDYERALGASLLSVYGRGTLYYPYQVDVEHVINSETGLRYRLTNRVRLMLRLEYDQLKGKTFSTEDSTLKFGVGADW